jgi:hypothetical protein
VAWFDYRGPKDNDDDMAWLQFALQSGIETTLHYAGMEIRVVQALHGSTVVVAVIAGTEFCAVVTGGILFVDADYLKLFGNMHCVFLSHEGFQNHYRRLRRLHPVA